MAQITEIRDKRKQTRRINIELESDYSENTLDDFVNDVITDLQIILKQRKQPKGLEIDVVIY